MKHVIVIGAGIAGLKASQVLAKHGLNVTLLEARNRVGGRIFTGFASDETTPIELGASFWEGFADNPFFLNYFQDPTQVKKIPFDKSLLFSSKTISPFKYYKQAQSLLAAQIPLFKNKTAHHLLQTLFEPPLDDKSYWLKKWMRYSLTHHCTSLQHIGFPDFEKSDDPLESDSDDANSCFVQGGYHYVAQTMYQQAIELGVEIHLRTPVTYIEPTPQGVNVKTVAGEWKADRVLVTIPLGVLKKKAHQLFPERFAADKFAAFKMVGVHDATRVVLEFAEPFWDNTQAPYIFIDKAPEKNLIEFRNGLPLHGKPILQTESYADYVSFLWKKKSDVNAENKLIDYIMKDLQAIYPKAPYPIHFVIYRWTSDPYACGSYPYRTPYINEAIQQAIERAEGNVYFAGADFSRYGFSVHQAFANGEKVAVRLMNEL